MPVLCLMTRCDKTHTDVKDLLYVGLIEETEDGLLSVPWDVIVSELPLLAKAR
jgi:hypothetical protein